MFPEFITLLALLVVHLGFAGLLGGLVNHVHTPAEGAELTFLALLYLAATFTLPMPAWANVLVLLAAIFLAALAVTRSKKPLFEQPISWSYIAFTMLLIALWCTAQGWHYPLLALGATAGVAAVLAIYKRSLAL